MCISCLSCVARMGFASQKVKACIFVGTCAKVNLHHLYASLAPIETSVTTPPAQWAMIPVIRYSRANVRNRDEEGHPKLANNQFGSLCKPVNIHRIHIYPQCHFGIRWASRWFKSGLIRLVILGSLWCHFVSVCNQFGINVFSLPSPFSFLVFSLICSI